MVSSPNLRELSIQEALPFVPLSDPEHAILAGSRAIEAYVGHSALLTARTLLDTHSSGDIDLVVSKNDYTHLKHVGARVVHHVFPSLSRPGRYYWRNSLIMFNGAVDIWRERWYEAARYPQGVVSIEELTLNSEWNEALGTRVLARQYLLDQRGRSVKFLEELRNRRTLTAIEEERLRKDRADLVVLE